MRYSLATLLLAAAMPAAAQMTPAGAPTTTHPAERPPAPAVMVPPAATGAFHWTPTTYVLTLSVTSAHRGTQTVPTQCNPPYCVNGQTQIVSSGTVAGGASQFTLTQDDGSTVQGTISGSQLHATGARDGSTLTLDGAPAANGASGTFRLQAAGNVRLDGNFTLAPQMATQQKKELQQYDPNHPAGQGAQCGTWCQIKEALHDWFGL
jgi:hypothetical protein